MHLAYVHQRFAQGLFRVRQGFHEVFLLIDEELLHLLQVERAFDGVQAAVELQDVAVEADAPRLHIRGLQHVAQLGLVVLDRLVHLLHPGVVLHHVEIHVALLRDVVGRH